MPMRLQEVHGLRDESVPELTPGDLRRAARRSISDVRRGAERLVEETKSGELAPSLTRNRPSDPSPGQSQEANP